MLKYVIYKTTNAVNGKIYIGFHGVDKDEDVKPSCVGGSIFDTPYFGSGVLIKSALKKYGSASFNQDLLFVTMDLQEGIAAEQSFVTEEFVNSDTTYNIAVGGHGCATEYTRTKRGQRVSSWIENNPESHRARMEKINKNPEKIRKMANKHRGMKRSDAAKQNISVSLQGKPSHSLGRVMAFDPSELSPTTRYFNTIDDIPDGWVRGAAMRGKKRGLMYTNGTLFKIFKTSEDVPDGWVRGAPKKNTGRKPVHAGKIIAYDPTNPEDKLRFFDHVDDIPDGWVRGRRKRVKIDGK